MFEWPSPIRSAPSGPEPSPFSSRKRSSGSRTISGSSSCSRASSGVSTTSAELIGRESLHAEPFAARMRKTGTMRFAAIRAILFALGATAAPASAADVSISNFAFHPPSVTINQGESVTWTWAGPDTNHSVTSDPNQADSFDSDPGRTPNSADHLPGSTFAHTFNTPGTFTYICKVHSFMTGKVVVNGPNGEPPPDTAAPAFTGASAKGGRKCRKGVKHCKAKPTTVKFTLSEDATVKLAVPKRPKAGVTRAFKAGAHSIKLSVKQLPPGKYTLKLTATDAAGNASPAKPLKVKVR